MNNISDSYSCIECLYNINSLKNLKSIFDHGILSKNLLKKNALLNEDLSNPSVQNRRECKMVPNHRPLHDYANLYFDARNPMLYSLLLNRGVDELCVLCIDKKVLDLPETVVTDRNAAAELAVFISPDKAISQLDFQMIFAKYWNDEDVSRKVDKKQVKCAEVLVLDKVPVEYIISIKIGSRKAKEKVEELNFGVPVVLDEELFFNKGNG